MPEPRARKPRAGAAGSEWRCGQLRRDWQALPAESRGNFASEAYQLQQTVGAPANGEQLRAPGTQPGDIDVRARRKCRLFRSKYDQLSFLQRKKAPIAFGISTAGNHGRTFVVIGVLTTHLLKD